MDFAHATLACFHRHTLGLMATIKRKTEGILAAVVVGKCAMGGMWTTVEQRHIPVSVMWNTTPYDSTRQTGPVPNVEHAIH